MIQTPIPGVICPSRRDAARLYPFAVGELPRNVSIEEGVGKANKTDYAASAGGDRTSNWAADACDTARPENRESCSGVMTGVVYQTSTVSIRRIEDGTSKTYLIGEKFLEPSQYFRGENRGDNNTALIGHHRDVLRFATRNFPPTRDFDANNNNHLTHSFGGPHSSGWQVVFCDGHVESVEFSINVDVFHSHGNRTDGTFVPAD